MLRLMLALLVALLATPAIAQEAPQATDVTSADIQAFINALPRDRVSHRQVDHALPLGQRLGRDLGQHGRHGRSSDDQRRRAGTDRGRGLLVNGIRTRASACTTGDAMPSHDRGAYGKNT